VRFARPATVVTAALLRRSLAGPAVSGSAASRVVLLAAQVAGHLLGRNRLQHGLGHLSEQAAGSACWPIGSPPSVIRLP
jgi:hypothetical protein